MIQAILYMPVSSLPFRELKISSSYHLQVFLIVTGIEGYLYVISAHPKIIMGAN